MNRRLRFSRDSTYRSMLQQLKNLEVLVATWQPTDSEVHRCVCVLYSFDFDAIAAKTQSGLYSSLCFFASTTGSEKYADYEHVYLVPQPTVEFESEAPPTQP